MRRLSLLLMLVPMVAFSCAQGQKLGRYGEYGAGAGDPGTNDEVENPENENEPDPGSTDPGTGGDEPSGGAGGGDIGDTGEECAHDPCSPGAALDENCHPCVFETCSADAFCCQGEWDETCVGQATACGCDPGAGAGGSGAGGSDPGPDPDPTPDPDPGPDPDPTGGTCSHDPYTTGDALDPSCDPCVEAICQSDPFCCDVEWDAFCVLDVITTCF